MFNLVVTPSTLHLQWHLFTYTGLILFVLMVFRLRSKMNSRQRYATADMAATWITETTQALQAVMNKEKARHVQIEENALTLSWSWTLAPFLSSVSTTLEWPLWQAAHRAVPLSCRKHSTNCEYGPKSLYGQHRVQAFLKSNNKKSSVAIISILAWFTTSPNTHTQHSVMQISQSAN